ncbi:class I SAM-dependent RNA methyltransferase [Phaeovulum vinaykumarii]|uniref:23S rRNA m(5)U-1939 methyltransferase n=1 Tax=Phaeovulum vinaykumarii TaxID=407234 RepID=A0A1N7KZU9_9RHOB|nr:class I SAM-dependent RNA methyltransferase [Phaeovulum vinaykumarii]SIS67105.1 23S rRNA m(5)U-1939 methyltransferase [Phaeovulum vinaykumarii]SOC00841.1 23S rRNA m(5)U-1939 methyltransferase [Phaeovulum vinaykumarii]
MKARISRLTLAGLGLAETDDGARVEVEGALPDEEIEGTPHEGRIAAPKILAPSPDRVRPPCPHARACGGCALQHAGDDFVARWKAGVIVRALAAQGLELAGPSDAGPSDADTPDAGLSDADTRPRLRPIVTSAPGTRRRATLAGRRTKSGVLVGFHARASGTIVPVPECRLLDPALLATLPALGEMTTAGASRKAEIAFALSRTEAGVSVAATGGKPLDAGLRAALAGIAAQADLADLAWEGEPVARARPPLVRLGPALLPLPPGAFRQATPEGEAALIAAVRTALGDARHVADLFAGIGTFALPLATRAEVHAVEGAAPALAALDAGWRATPDLRRISTETRDLFRRPLLPDELARFDAVVLDPPRAGAAAQAAELARPGGPRVLAYVSCNPVSFARDLRVLADGGWRLDWVQPVDQFRWSGHVELAARLVR